MNRQMAERYHPEDQDYYHREQILSSLPERANPWDTTRLKRWGDVAFSLLVGAAVAGFVFIIASALQALLTGRVAQILHAIQTAGR
jgi:hypothetical protein